MADIYTLIDREGTPFPVMVFAPPEDKNRNVRVIILPGANCAVTRYRWLADPLAAEGATVFIPDPPLLEHPSPLDPTVKVEAAYVTIDQMIKTLAMPWKNTRTDERADDENDALTFAIGHSLGGSILLEYFDPAQAMADPRSGVGAGYKPPVPLHGAVILGASMQADVMGVTIPWRQNDTPLDKPDGLPVLFIAGENDGMATPDKVSATVGRYTAPTAMIVQKGANHFGWTEGEGALDRRDMDGPATLPPEKQKAGTIRLTAAFFSAIADEKPDTIGNVLRDVCADGDTVDVR